MVPTASVTVMAHFVISVIVIHSCGYHLDGYRLMFVHVRTTLGVSSSLWGFRGFRGLQGASGGFRGLQGASGGFRGFRGFKGF